jgi:hypothetical protein
VTHDIRDHIRELTGHLAGIFQADCLFLRANLHNSSVFSQYKSTPFGPGIVFAIWLLGSELIPSLNCIEVIRGAFVVGYNKTTNISVFDITHLES